MKSKANVNQLRRDGTPDCARLGNTQNSFPVLTDLTNVQVERRKERWALRDTLNEFSSLKRCRSCGKTPRGNRVEFRGSSGRAGYAGLVTCGSVWACPVCAAKISAVRKSDLETLIEKAIEQGKYVSMLTLTQRHNKGQSLGYLWDSLTYAWSSVVGGRRWLAFKEQMGLVGYVKAVEVTHGANGWHVHTHVLVITDKDPRKTVFTYQKKQGRRIMPYAPEVYTPAQFISERWGAALAKKSVDFIANSGGLDWQTPDNRDDWAKLGAYVGKLQGASGLSAEATLGAFKQARGENRTPFQILADFKVSGDMADLDLWHCWEKNSRGKRALIWSNGLRDWADLGIEKTDEEIAEEDLGSDVLAVFDKSAWRKIRAVGAFLFIQAYELHGKKALYELIDEHKIHYFVPKPPQNN